MAGVQRIREDGRRNIYEVRELVFWFITSAPLGVEICKPLWGQGFGLAAGLLPGLRMVSYFWPERLAMTTTFQDLKAALGEVDAFLGGSRSGYKVSVPAEIDVKSIRKGLHMTQ